MPVPMQMKMFPKNISVSIIIIVSTLCFPYCASFTSVDLSLRPGTKTVSMTTDINRKYEVVKHIVVQQKVSFLFLVRMNAQNGSVDLNELLRSELSNSQADALVNVSIRGKVAIGDVALPLGIGFLGGIMFPPLFLIMVIPMYEDLKTYEVEGDLVRYIDQPAATDQSVKPFDPLTGVPVEKKNIQFDPETGLPVKK